MIRVLVDTSAWVAFLRGDADAIARIDPLLADDRVAICGPIYTELISGARTRPEFKLLRTKLRALPWVSELDDEWEKVGEARYALARSGFQAATIDVMIAIAASHTSNELMTRDSDFVHIRRIVPFELDLF